MEKFTPQVLLCAGVHEKHLEAEQLPTNQLEMVESPAQNCKQRFLSSRKHTSDGLKKIKDAPLAL